MTTLPGPKTVDFPENSLEKQVYSVAEDLKEYLPVPNDRNRLGYMLFKFFNKQGDGPEIIIKSGKFTIEGISKDNLISLLSEKIKSVKIAE
ncbi:MAG: hypothetical protein IPI12_14850 [Ignavibacteriales bacterium]|jgi:hypothetical protein|nr:hypothetical protein [Ignavibacteriales bacterium]